MIVIFAVSFHFSIFYVWFIFSIERSVQIHANNLNKYNRYNSIWRFICQLFAFKILSTRRDSQLFYLFFHHMCTFHRFCAYGSCFLRINILHSANMLPQIEIFEDLRFCWFVLLCAIWFHFETTTFTYQIRQLNSYCLCYLVGI
uniref:Very-long-chain 3-oxoacyl-CoA synthase n=1 Tax=Parascaris univalens TaxID=6257 RepID=A0A915B1F8_PARUN